LDQQKKERVNDHQEEIDGSEQRSAGTAHLAYRVSVRDVRIGARLHRKNRKIEGNALGRRFAAGRPILSVFYAEKMGIPPLNFQAGSIDPGKSAKFSSENPKNHT
jgi:hypothetical protein